MAAILHPLTQLAVQEYISKPAQALLITGPGGSGKGSLAWHMVSEILQISRSSPESEPSNPYLRIIRPETGKSIPIETVRELQHFLSLSIPGSRPGSIARIALIEDAHHLTPEAQNALLKTLEEPPADTVIILTATGMDAVLPTIQSRVRQLAVLPPPRDKLVTHFESLGYPADEISRALMLGGELPGLASALLAQDTEHALVAATTHARGILQSKTYERLLLVDGLSKQKPLCLDVLFVLGQMSRMALERATDNKAAARWQRVLRATYDATEQLQHNTQTKLVLTNLMLEL
jgi:DNA polymerase III delta prime subunit